MGIVSAAVSSGQFFSVRYSCVISGQSFRPAVCYRLTADLQRVVEEMKEKGLARSYPSEVRFVSGGIPGAEAGSGQSGSTGAKR
jgi:hypothetical protein